MSKNEQVRKNQQSRQCSESSSDQNVSTTQNQNFWARVDSLISEAAEMQKAFNDYDRRNRR